MDTYAHNLNGRQEDIQRLEQERKRRELAEALEQISRQLSSSLNLEEVLALILDQLSHVVPYERCSIMLQQDDALHMATWRGFPKDKPIADLEVPIREDDVYQQIINTGKPLMLDDVTADPHWYQVDWLPINLSWLGVPLISKDNGIGMISMTRREASAFSADDAHVVAAFSGHAAVALENARLYEKITALNENLEQTVADRTAKLEKAYKDLEHLDRTKSDFINVVAHELRTPLTISKGYTQVLLKSEAEGVPHPEQKMVLDGILNGVDRIQEIVDGMLDLTRLEQDVMTMHKADTTISNIFARVTALFNDALHQRNLALTANGLDELPIIHADSDLLFKVFYHLIMNAIKYVPDGGSISITANTISEPDTDSVVEIIISDTGIGIDPDHQELIFKKFYQTGKMSVHSSGKTKFKGGGAGLGLAIVRGIISAHQGKIWVESEGHDEANCPGSQFYVRLPIRV